MGSVNTDAVEKCYHHNRKSDGTCSDGCCDDYICLDCDKRFRVECPD